ncbi:DUF3943 domain-containing protein [Prevotella lacticifex]|uniref:DUF3943 domain-containing protein n=1 Tax=Prevotella lacticifex TaxID=2854755 RepID=UPI001CC3EA13|nr:DUF3943 domain-containing protein [Prevotella lacticifex]GJG36429.1 hypothetical protein PRLR5003_15860 [Prevotella lacticifex]
MKRRLLFIIILFLSTSFGYCQETGSDSAFVKTAIPRHFYKNLAFGGQRRESDSLCVASVNVGLWTAVDTLRGLQLGLFKSGTSQRMSGVSIGGIFNGHLGSVSGVQAALGTNLTVGMFKGLQLGSFNVAGYQHGLQVGMLSNLSAHPLYGVQIAALTNVTKGMRGGVQVGMLNINSGDQRGFQFGTYNYADTLCGFQLGIINVTDRSPKGYQIGILNMTNENDSRHLGLININPRTRIQLMAYSGNYNKLSVGVRFRNRSTYYIVGLNSFYSGFGVKNYSGGIGYRIGQYFNLSPKFSLSGDIGYSHIETFQDETATRPERMYSLEWRINADWQINKYLGAFVSGGYGQTRWYNHHRRFNSKPIVEAGLTFDLRPLRNDVSGLEALARRKGMTDRQFEAMFGIYKGSERDSLYAYNLPSFMRKRPWRAVAEDVGINLLVHYFDRFVLNADYAQTNFSTMADNFRNGFVWDNDQFSTNQFAHPYHGNLYFNTARNNGLNFWTSIPYALGGSLMWEFWGENEPPAINDVISTTCGGMALGEVFYRTSALALDDSKVGWPRFWHELAAGILNPVRLFNRIITGDAWRVRTSHNLYHDYNRIPVDATVMIGGRYVADENSIARGSRNLRFGFHLDYGDSYADEPTQPYDYFTADIGFNVGTQPFLSDVHLIGRLYGHNIYEGKRFRAQWGIFQHFDYYASDSIRGSEMKNPFEISETAAFGPGLLMQFPATGSLSLLEQKLYVNGILLGGSKSDYYHIIDRDYNIGSGFGWKSNTRMNFKNFGNFILNVEYYRLWTWKGFEKKDIEAPDFNPLFLNAQGDKSNAQLLVIAPVAEIKVGNGWNIIIHGAFYNRLTHYAYHPNKHSSTYELTVGGAFHF